MHVLGKAMAQGAISEGCLTLDQLIEKLEWAASQKDPDREAQSVYFDFCDLTPTKLDSWRGVYALLALGWSERGDMLLPDLLAECRSAVGKTFEGWKGGSYIMTKNTPVMVANRGAAGSTGICDVKANSYSVTLVTKTIDAFSCLARAI